MSWSRGIEHAHNTESGTRCSITWRRGCCARARRTPLAVAWAHEPSLPGSPDVAARRCARIRYLIRTLMDGGASRPLLSSAWWGAQREIDADPRTDYGGLTTRSLQDRASVREALATLVRPATDAAGGNAQIRIAACAAPDAPVARGAVTLLEHVVPRSLQSARPQTHTR